MSTVAICRILYGEDWIRESIESLLPYVDRFVLFWTDRSWAGPEAYVVGKDQPADGWRERVEAIGSDKVELVYDHVPDPMGQHQHLVNDRLVPEFGKPDLLIVSEADHVWRNDQIEAALEQFRSSGRRVAGSRMVELWKGPRWRVPERPWNTAAVFWNLKTFRRMPPTGRAGEPLKKHHLFHAKFPLLDAHLHNLGFCLSEEAMRMKLELARRYSPVIGDLVPGEHWIERVWLPWSEDNQLENLEFGSGMEDSIPRAVPYDPDLCPDSVRRRYGLIGGATP